MRYGIYELFELSIAHEPLDQPLNTKRQYHVYIPEVQRDQR